MSSLKPDEVTSVLKRLLSHGPLTNLPKRRADLTVVLALAAVQLIQGDSLDEAHVNEVLENWLSSFCSPYAVDHVTMRRYLVDARLVERDRGGSVYRVNERAVDRIIDPSARGISPDRILAQVAEERARGKGSISLSKSDASSAGCHVG